MSVLPPNSAWLFVIFCFFVSALFLWHYICTRPADWIADLVLLGTPRTEKLPGTVVVCGGSIAGMVTARICADHFANVILVDPEAQNAGKSKTRVVQYNIPHIFLGLFLDGARRLWPNFDTAVWDAGARIGSTDLQLHYSGVKILTPSRCLRDTIMARRSSLQDILFKLLSTHSASQNVTVVAGTIRSVSVEGSFISSALVRTLDGQDMTLDDIALVADCSGPTQAGLKWLRNKLPENLRCSYKVNLQYFTICFTVSEPVAATLPIPDDAVNAMATYFYNSHFTFSSVLFGIFPGDNNILQLVIGGSGDLPSTMDEVLPFLEGIRGHAPPPAWFLTTVRILCEKCAATLDLFKTPTQSYIQYHLAPPGAIPSNFVAVGDAEMNLNPIHGQGFAKIVLNGLTLNSVLASVAHDIPEDFSSRYFKLNATRTRGLWDATRLHDYGFDSCEPMAGETKETGWPVRWLEVKLLSAAAEDEDVAFALWRVRHMLATETILLAPRRLWKILCTRSRFALL